MRPQTPMMPIDGFPDDDEEIKPKPKRKPKWTSSISIPKKAVIHKPKTVKKLSQAQIFAINSPNAPKSSINKAAVLKRQQEYARDRIMRDAAKNNPRLRRELELMRKGDEDYKEEMEFRKTLSPNRRR